MDRELQADPLAKRLRIFGKDPGEPTRSGAPLTVTWEHALERLSHLPRMFIEPDGSFLWTGDQFEIAWQMEGTVYDDGRVVRYIDLCGNCPTVCWQAFLEAFEATWSSITVEMLDDHRVVDGQWLLQLVMRNEGAVKWK